MIGIVANIILIVVLLIAVGGAIRYIYKEKKKGSKCIGCPYSAGCSGGCHGGVPKTK